MIITMNLFRPLRCVAIPNVFCCYSVSFGCAWFEHNIKYHKTIHEIIFVVSSVFVQIKNIWYFARHEQRIRKVVYCQKCTHRHRTESIYTQLLILAGRNGQATQQMLLFVIKATESPAIWVLYSYFQNTWNPQICLSFALSLILTFHLVTFIWSLVICSDTKCPATYTHEIAIFHAKSMSRQRKLHFWFQINPYAQHCRSPFTFHTLRLVLSSFLTRNWRKYTQIVISSYSFHCDSSCHSIGLVEVILSISICLLSHRMLFHTRSISNWIFSRIPIHM